MRSRSSFGILVLMGRVLCVSALLAVTAQASQTVVRPTGASWNVDANSGNARRTNITGTFDTSGHPYWIDRLGYIYAIEWSERGDDPCYFKIFTARLAGSQPGTQPGTSRYTYELKSKELQLAGGCPRNESSLKRIQYQQPNAPGWTTNGLPNFVSGIKMCGNDERSSNREKLKGIALSATQVATDGRFVNVGGELREERPNCRKWYAKVSCPAGQAAYGLQVLGSSSAKGIQLECAPLRR